MKMDHRRTDLSKVVSKHPPAWVMRYLANPLTRRLLPTRFGGHMKPLALVRVTGRRTGTMREVPCGVFEVAGGEVAFSDGTWRLNLRGGADVEIVRGRERRWVRAELIDDPEIVGPTLQAVVEIVGPRKLMLEVHEGAAPDDFAAAGRSMIRFIPLRDGH